MRMSSQHKAWGTDIMRSELRNNFRNYARLYGSKVGVTSLFGLHQQTSDLYVYFADRIVGYIHDWRLEEPDTVIICHFAVALDLKGLGFAEPLICGFGNAVREEKGVRRILFQERALRTEDDARFFGRIGATPTGRVVDRNTEWEWIIP